jgi:DmpG-like protein
MREELTILLEVGRRKMIGGQEDMVADVGQDLAAQCGASGAAG